MSARVFLVTFKSEGKVLATMEVSRGDEPILIGRSHSCALRAPADDHSVSGKHARLFWKGSSLFLEDSRSRNGVFFNGKRIEKPLKVEKDGLYVIGNCQLSVGVPGKGGSGKKSRYHQLEFLNGDRARQLMDICPKPGAPDGAFTIGLDPGCDICLPDMLVSRQHARLVVRSNGDCWISDMGSRNGTFINGEKLGGKERLLRDGDKISIAYFDLRFLDRGVAHTRAYLWAKLGVLLITGIVLATGYVIWKYNPNRLKASDYRELAARAAENEHFDNAIAFLDEAVMAPNGTTEKLQNDTLRGQIRQWKDTYERWNSIREAFDNGYLRDARIRLANLMAETYAWSWNNTSALEMRKDAEFAQKLMRMCTDAANAEDIAEKDIAVAMALSDHIKKIDDYLQAEATALKARPYLGSAVKLLEKYKGKFAVIRDGIAKIDAALGSVVDANPDFSAAAATFARVADSETLPSGVRNYARSLLPVCNGFIATQKFLDKEKVMVSDMEFAAVLKQANALPLPDKDACARQIKFSDARASFQKRHAAYQQEVSILGPMVRNLESAGVRNGEKGHLLTFATDPATWKKALLFDCFQNRFPMSSRVDPTGVYDELVGIEYTYENLRELPRPPGRQTAVLMNFVPKCQTAKAAFEQVRTFLVFMERPEGKEFRIGKLGRLYALGAQILADRERLIAALKKEFREATSDRAKIVAGYYAEYFSDEPSYADLRSLEMAFRKLQKQVNEMNEKYNAEPDPAKRLELRKAILGVGIPGMESVRMRWVEVEAE